MTMQTVSFKITEEMLKKIDELVDKGIFISRSDLIRSALRMLLEQYQKVIKTRVESYE